MTYDLIIKNATIIDGTGRDRFTSDIGILDDKILKIGILSDASSKNVIDASGKIVSPGFIDLHTHAIDGIPLHPEAENFINQGVTSVVGTNCGNAVFPLHERWYIRGFDMEVLNQTHPKSPGLLKASYDLEDIKKRLKDTLGYEVKWKTMNEYFSYMENKGFSINLYPLTPHTNIREMVLGPDAFRIATDEEIEKMKEILRHELRNGSQGFTTGLSNESKAYKGISFYAETKEIVELAKVLGEFENKTYFTHVRYINMLSKKPKMDAIEGIKEAIEIARQAKCRLQISHINGLLDEGPSEETSIRKGQEILDLINGAIKEGIDVSFDLQAGETGGGFHVPQLAFFVRPIAQLFGSLDKFQKRLNNRVIRSILVAMFKSMIPEEEQYGLDVVIHKSAKYPQHEGKKLSEIASLMDMHIIEALFELLRSDIDTRMIIPYNRFDAIQRLLLEHPMAMPSSDANAYNNEPYIMKLSNEYILLPNPIMFNNSIIYMKDYGCNRLEDTIHKLTGLPADRIFLDKRGVLKEGNYADIVIFDWDNLKANMNFDETWQSPDGIDYVIVNGKITSINKKHTGEKAGVFLK